MKRHLDRQADRAAGAEDRVSKAAAKRAMRLRNLRNNPELITETVVAGRLSVNGARVIMGLPTL